MELSKDSKRVYIACFDESTKNQVPNGQGVLFLTISITQTYKLASSIYRVIFKTGNVKSKIGTLLTIGERAEFPQFLYFYDSSPSYFSGKIQIMFTQGV